MTGPVISTTVVLACRDQGADVHHAHEEIRALDPPVELLVVDDWCRDVSTMEALSALEAGGQPVVRAPRTGRAAAWNAAVDAGISTEFVALLDVDDSPASAFVAAATRYLDAHPDISFVLAVDAATASASDTQTRQVEVLELLILIRPHRRAVLRRSLWETTGRFDVSLGELCEIDLWLTALEHNHRGTAIPISGMVHRIGQARTEPEQWQRLRKQLFEKHLETVRQHGESLFVAQEALILDLRRRQEELVGRAHHLDEQLAGLESGTTNLVTDLECRPR